MEKTTTSVNSSVFSLPCWIHVAMLVASPACRASSEVGRLERPQNAVRGGSVLHYNNAGRYEARRGLMVEHSGDAFRCDSAEADVGVGIVNTVPVSARGKWKFVDC